MAGSQQSIHDFVHGDTDSLLEKTDDSFTSEKENRKRHSIMKRGIIKLTLAVMCLVLLLLTFFGGGLLVGWKLLNANGSSAATDASNDWGEYVTIDGRLVPVDQWISENIIPENIKNNLMLVSLTGWFIHHIILYSLDNLPFFYHSHVIIIYNATVIIQSYCTPFAIVTDCVCS